MAEKVYKYDVFLSHSSKDKDFVRMLYKRLRAEGIDPFFDETEIPWGGNIPTTVAEAVDNSRYLIVVLSPDAAGSDWVDMEASISIFRSPGGKEGRILPLLYRDCEKIPAAISFRRRFSVRNDREFEAAWPQIVKYLGGTVTKKGRGQIAAGKTTRQMIGHPGKKNIVVVCPLFGASRIYYTELLAAITEMANMYKYGLAIVPISGITHKPSLVSHYPQLSSAAGVILITCQVKGSTWLDECASLRLPVVLLHDNIPEEKAKGYTVVSYIWPRVEALSELVTHLAEVHRCRNLSVVMVSPRSHAIRTQKLLTIEQAIQSCQLEFIHDRQLYCIKEYSHMEGMRITDEILERNPETDAIVCLADITAIGILQRLTEMELQNRIRVTGFDNTEVSTYSNLTTVDQQLRLTGERALLDLHNAIQHGSCAEFRCASYIATSLVERRSCCFESKVGLLRKATTCRRAIHYLVRHPTISAFVQSFRHRLRDLDMKEFDTTELIGSAARYPDHITVIGTFTLEKETDVSRMCDEIEDAMRHFQPFIVATSELRHFPSGTLSIGLTAESRVNLLALQRAILPIVKQYRRRPIEPEFRKYLYSREASESRYTKEFGEPFVLELYRPHITLASGMRSQDDYAKLRKLARNAGSSGIIGTKLTVSDLWLMEEEEIGGNWEAIRPFEI